MSNTFRCYLVQKSHEGKVEAKVNDRPLADLPDGDLLIRVAYSSLNYKDALAATGHPGVVRKFPHVPGIDAAGTVVETSSKNFQVGDEVLVTSYELGVERWGAWAEYVRVSSDWVLPLPHGLSLAEAMAFGTAGLTAALCVLELEEHGITPESGEIVVTGATGGVGIHALKILSSIGYSVVAVSGKKDRHTWLADHGASRVISREDILDSSRKPLLAARWAGGVDTVGGNTLTTLLKSVKPGGCVAACGLVGGVDLPLTVYPFILRGVTLAGVDSAWCPGDRRRAAWAELADDWKPTDLSSLVETIGLDALGDNVRKILAGETAGRVILELATQ